MNGIFEYIGGVDREEDKGIFDKVDSTNFDSLIAYDRPPSGKVDTVFSLCSSI